MAVSNVDLEQIFNQKELLKAPVKRAAYSDRTSWLLACMSELAYYPFETVDQSEVSQFVQEFSGISKEKEIREKLAKFLEAAQRSQLIQKDFLKTVLESADFELINTYNLDETQGFMAKKTDPESPMLVLAFRGTEKKLADIRTDAKADLVNVDNEEKVHVGFYKAYKKVESEIAADLEGHSGIPVYIAGHSLGGALAIVATRYLSSDALGACYTYGSPRVGNEYMEEAIKTPIYRINNAGDVVPYLPPMSAFVSVLAKLISFIPVVGGAGKWLKSNYQGYMHFGDLRYLTYAQAGTDDSFPDVKLLSNPPLMERLRRNFDRLISSKGKLALDAHSISLYRRKLCAYAKRRN